MDRQPSPAAPRLRIDPDAIPHDAAKVIRRLVRHGFRAYLVGGCVRDLLLKLRPKDFDLATSARPRQVRRLFRNSRIIGRRFRLVHIRFGPHILEVATFRAPPPPTEGSDLYIERDNIFGTEREDAFRRDFTINGLFYDLDRRKVIDHVDGVADLEARLIRTIGDPDVRLREDPVRILRAAKFAARLGFELTPELREAVARHATDLERAAPARVLEEIYRLLSNRGAATSLRLLEELGALQVLIPEIAPAPPPFFEALGRLETLCDGDRDGLPQWMLVAVLLAPAAYPVLAETDAHDVEAALHDALQPIATRLTVARRDIGRARQCLAAQVRLAEPPRGGRRGRRYARREFFQDALRLRRVLGPLGEAVDDGEALAEWEDLGREAGPGGGQRGKGGRKRRRRRGGRRRQGLRERGKGGKDTACPPPPASSSAPAPPPPPETSPNDSSSGDSSPA